MNKGILKKIYEETDGFTIFGLSMYLLMVIVFIEHGGFL